MSRNTTIRTRRTPSVVASRRPSLGGLKAGPPHDETWLGRLARYVLAHRRRVLGLWLLVTDVAVVTGIGRTGRLVTSAALVLFLGFVAMSSAPSTAIKMMATGLGAGILLDATIARCLLVPAAVSLFGKWNWWMPVRLGRLLRVSATR